MECVRAMDICAQLMAWSRQYPDPSAPAGQNEAARAAEDKFLARFAGLVSLDRDQVAELVGWKFHAMAHRKALAMRGISPQRWDGRDGGPGAAALRAGPAVRSQPAPGGPGTVDRRRRS